MTWLDAPTHEGLWWLRNGDITEPVRIHAMWRDQDDGTLRFGVEHLGTEDMTHEHDTPGQWRQLVRPVPALDTRDPNPTVPGSPGERRMRRG